MFNRVLIANRGEIAIRIIRACREMGVHSIAVMSEADVDALHVQMADEAILLGPAAPSESYLNIPRIIEAARRVGADAVHPGFGFLSENARFAAAVQDAGMVFIGPRPDAIAAMGSKTGARALMEKAGVSIIPGYQGEDQSVERLKDEAAAIGYPVLVKAAAGGGGKGMRIVHQPSDLMPSIEAARRESQKAFGDATVFLERYIVHPRHIEFQVFGDQHGNVVHLFERECSIQRRHQKVIEETPSVALTPALREAMGAQAVAAARAVGYSNAGTVEFILDQEGRFYFLEMNTRLQVEHPITESVVGLDLVRLQLEVASGARLPFTQSQVSQRGHAIEARIYAEDPANGFLPSAGRILALKEPSGPFVRVDSSLFAGMDVPVHYDPMLAKLIVWGSSRTEAIARMEQALGRYVLLGITHNIPFLRDVVMHPAFREGRTYTSFIAENLANWAPEQTAPDTDIFIGAAVAEFLQKGTLEVAEGAGTGPRGGDPYSPWERLGGWRM